MYRDLPKDREARADRSSRRTGFSVTFHTLYGTPLSLYTGKARSYLIKKHLPYREVTPTTTHFEEYVRPRAKMRMMPTLETSEGAVIRDGAAIVEHFESQSGHRATPRGTRQRILSRLLDVIGMEGLLRPAMHYRWNFPEENEAFLLHHFSAIAAAHADPADFAAQNMGRLMGERPSIGDFSLIAPLYGHLGRDPKPLSLMQSNAVHLFRWVERMNRPEPDCGEFVKDGVVASGADFDLEDEIPDTLVAVLRQMAVDFVPETLAAADYINGWLDAQTNLVAGTPLERGVGIVSFEVEGSTVNALAQPYRFFLLNRVHADFDEMSAEEQSRAERTLQKCDLLPVLSARLKRSIGRQDNLEVWL
jgi:glutathione S-transferase